MRPEVEPAYLNAAQPTAALPVPPKLPAAAVTNHRPVGIVMLYTPLFNDDVEPSVWFA